MAVSSTPETDKWQDIHARAYKAEQNIVFSALGYITAGSALPTDLSIETAKTLRTMASIQFDVAVRELLGIAKGITLGSRLRPPPNEGDDVSGSPA